MFDLISSLLQIEVLVTMLIGLAAFATVLTVAAPYFENDKLKTRMKSVGQERDKLRAAQRAALIGPESKLREKKNTSLSAQLVEALNLRRLFEAEGSRDLLRQAGYRNENHLVTFLAARLAAPIMLALIAFAYSSTLYADKVPPPMRVGLAGVGLVLGYYLPTIFIKNLVSKRQLSIRRAWSDALDLLLICVESGMAIEPALQRGGIL